MSELCSWGGWIVTDPAVLALFELPDTETPRRLASPLALPGNDFWLFDAETVIFSVFAGTGEVVERQLYTSPTVVRLCRSAFGAAWELAIPHRDYQPT